MPAERVKVAQWTRELWRHTYFGVPPPELGTRMDSCEHAYGLRWEVEHMHPTPDSDDKQFDRGMQKVIVNSKVDMDV
jgi:hypothetical protein